MAEFHKAAEAEDPFEARAVVVDCPPGYDGMGEMARAFVEEFAKLVRESASQRPDFICLPEGITVIGTGMKYVEVAEPVPGPTTKRLGELAREARAYIVAGIYERVGSTVYNTAVLIDREGRLAGTYRKVVPRSRPALRLSASAPRAMPPRARRRTRAVHDIRKSDLRDRFMQILLHRF